MTMWSDNRNHLLDDVIHDTIIVVVAQLIGVAPGQFIAIVAFTQLSESLQHANLRLCFGAIGERLWISPRFHRRAPQHRHRPRVARPDARWAATTSACCCPGGTCCFAPSISSIATTRPAFATRSSPTRRAACATTGAASGRSNGWACGAWSGAAEAGPDRALGVSSPPMRLLLDSFWRAVAYCLRPRVIVLSLLPLALMVALAAGLGYFYLGRRRSPGRARRWMPGRCWRASGAGSGALFSGDVSARAGAAGGGAGGHAG